MKPLYRWDWEKQKGVCVMANFHRPQCQCSHCSKCDGCIKCDPYYLYNRPHLVNQVWACVLGQRV